MTISLRLTRGCRALAFINETVSYYPCAFICIIKYIFDPNVFVKTEKSFKSKLYFLLSIEKEKIDSYVRIEFKNIYSHIISKIFLSNYFLYKNII